MAVAAGLLATLAACKSGPRAPSPEDSFGSTTTYSRRFDASAAQTCEAARRSLLGQGYVINTSRADLIEGRKHFQPQPESHMQMEIRVVCVPDGENARTSLGFVTALQDRYALKKSANSASVGVSVLGSVSLPFSSSNDSMVKIASETIASQPFYDSFFDSVKRYLQPGAAEPAEPFKTP